MSGALLFSTYLGGSGLDQGNGIAVDTPAMPTSPAQRIRQAWRRQVFCKHEQRAGDAFVAKYTASQAAPALGVLHLPRRIQSGHRRGHRRGSDRQRLHRRDDCFDGLRRPPVTRSSAPMAVATRMHSSPSSIRGRDLLYSSYLGGTNTEVAYGIAIDNARSRESTSPAKLARRISRFRIRRSQLGRKLRRVRFQDWLVARYRDCPDGIGFWAADTEHH